MSEFINTIDSLGDELTLGKLIDGSLTEVKDDVITKLKQYCFYNNTNLVSVDLPNVTYVAPSAFENCTNLTTVNLPKITVVNGYIFSNCSSLTILDLPNATTMYLNSFRDCTNLTSINLPKVTLVANTAFFGNKLLKKIDLPLVTKIDYAGFSGCSSLETLILRSGALCSLSNANAFQNTPIASGTGYIYVPRALIDSYKSATNWSTYANQFRILEDYTIDGTVDGEFVTPTMTRALLNRTIEKFDSSASGQVSFGAFQDCSNLTAVILRSNTMCSLQMSQAFSSTPIASGTGYIYVPSILVDTYKSATNWSVYANQFRAIEDYPEICGGEV